MQVLNACDHPGSDIVFCCKLLSAGMGGLSLLVLSPDTVAPPSLSTTSTADLATTASVCDCRVPIVDMIRCCVCTPLPFSPVCVCVQISSSRRSGGSVVLPQDFGAPDVTAKSRRSGSPLKKASLRASKSAPSLRKLDVTAAAKSVTFPAEVPESPGGCPMVDKALAVIIRTVILANEREFLEVLRAAVQVPPCDVVVPTVDLLSLWFSAQAAANVCVLPWVQSAFVKEGGVPPVCSLLVHLWDVPRIVNAVCSFISNMARTKSPSFRYIQCVRLSSAYVFAFNVLPGRCCTTTLTAGSD